jgi:molybdopterin synthase catalytic subunit
VDVTVRLFASLRERAGAGTVSLQLGDGATVADAIEQLRAGALAGLPENAPFVTAVAREYVPTDHLLSEGDELALVPPVSGGSGAVRFVEVTGEPLDPEALRRLVADPSTGATVVFCGTTREVPALEYEAYVEMAEEKIRRLAEAVVAEHGLAAVAVSHRTGTVELMEPSVVIAVSAGHRAEAFEGAHALLNAVKSQAPIWKQEHPEDGPPSWVEGTLPQV